jgi:hypothetical protein
VAVVANYAYVADDDAGLRIISVSDPAHPTEVGYYDTPGIACGVAAVGNYAYVADDDAGLQVYQFYAAGVEEGKTPDAERTTPVPTIVRGVLCLPASSVVRQASSVLFDISGRAVTELHSGPNDVSQFSPGVYFVRTEGQGAEAVRRVVIAK